MKRLVARQNKNKTRTIALERSEAKLRGLEELIKYIYCP